METISPPAMSRETSLSATTPFGYLTVTPARRTAHGADAGASASASMEERVAGMGYCRPSDCAARATTSSEDGSAGASLVMEYTAVRAADPSGVAE